MEKFNFMKIPIYEEILIDNFDIENIKIQIEESRIGQVPAYINLAGMKKQEIEILVANLEQILVDLNLHPNFPYPLYLITPTRPKTFLNCVNSVKELPDHFFKKVKRPTNKEIYLLNKLSIKVEKIKNLDLYNLLNKLDDDSISQELLFLETKELYFLEELKSVLQDGVKK